MPIKPQQEDLTGRIVPVFFLFGFLGKRLMSVLCIALEKIEPKPTKGKYRFWRVPVSCGFKRKPKGKLDFAGSNLKKGTPSWHL